jgi:hypothetical protein
MLENSRNCRESMAKLTITFKGKPLQSLSLGTGEIGIGSDPSNTLHIDSLAVAPNHAIVTGAPQKGYLIQAINDDFPIIVNEAKISEHRLKHGDRIHIGKHMLYFTDEQRFATNGPQTQPDEVELAEPASPKPHPLPFFEGSFQVMNGKQIGLVIPLKKAVTRIGKQDSGMLIVTRNKSGYEASPGGGNTRLTINGIPLETDSSPLRDGDVVKLNNTLLLFFQR